MSLRSVFNRVDFVGGWKLWFAISGVLLLLGIGAVALGNLNFGIDFQGGTKFTASDADRRLSEGEVRDALPNFVAQEAVIQQAGEAGYEVRTPVISEEERGEVRNALREALGAEVSETSISPTFGSQLRNQALQAIGAALLVIVIFISIRFEFAFAISAMAALVHDILMTIGFYALVGREVNLVTIVALLT
ncbi:MAG: protein translocase subunit SecF, partial [Actinomycetota bacterium]|nr:protein translocase subunit SecF [Actinomycetota bacterium]